MTLPLRVLALLAAVVAAPLRAQEQPVRLAASTSASPARDSAILRLEAFLARYPNSPLRPEALLELGELLVREANDRFAETQRTSAAATGDTMAVARGEGPIRPDFTEAVQRYEELIR